MATVHASILDQGLAFQDPPPLRHKPALRCLKTAAAAQLEAAKAEATVHNGGKPSSSAVED